MAELRKLAENAESDAARVAAMKELLDRGYGRPKQEIELDAHVTHENLLDQIAQAEGKRPLEAAVVSS
jgi:hypothetical protein